MKIVICNDSDHETVEKCKHIYKVLNDMEIPITIAVFCKTEGTLKHDTQSLEDEDYVKFLKEMRVRGNEIAFHGYSDVSNTRKQFKEGIKIYEGIFGEKPFTYIEHGGVKGYHKEEVCKKEAISYTLKEREYCVLDLVINNFKAFCPTHLSNHEFNINDLRKFKPEGSTYSRDFFHNLPNTFSDIVYTHFGYQNQLVGWHEDNLKKNLELLKKLKDQGVEFVTMEGYVINVIRNL